MISIFFWYLIVFPPCDRRRPQQCPRCSALRCGLDPRWASQPGPSRRPPFPPQRTEGGCLVGSFFSPSFSSTPGRIGRLVFSLSFSLSFFLLGACKPILHPLRIVQKGSGRVPGRPPRGGRPLHPPRPAPPGALLTTTRGLIPPFSPHPQPSVWEGNNGKSCGLYTSAYFRGIAFSCISPHFPHNRIVFTNQE